MDADAAQPEAARAGSEALPEADGPEKQAQASGQAGEAAGAEGAGPNPEGDKAGEAGPAKDGEAGAKRVQLLNAVRAARRFKHAHVTGAVATTQCTPTHCVAAPELQPAAPA